MIKSFSGFYGNKINYKLMKTNRNFRAFMFLLLMALVSSCQYDTLVKPVIPPPKPTDTISFTKTIEPIFNNNSNCTVCHNTGGQAPDLMSGYAYNSIKNMGLINISDPVSSTIYWIPNPDNSSNHTWKKYTNVQAQFVLQWIKQGALNN